METDNYEGFIATLRDAGNVLEITVDSKIIQAMGLKKGDLLKVWIKKYEKEK